MTGLVCLSLLALEREPQNWTWGMIRISTRRDIQGFVLRPASREVGDGGELDTYERVGYFTTSYVMQLRAARRARKKLAEADVRELRLWGSSGERRRGTRLVSRRHYLHY